MTKSQASIKFNNIEVSDLCGITPALRQRIVLDAGPTRLLLYGNYFSEISKYDLNIKIGPEMYDLNDYELLKKLLAEFSERVITPEALVEATDLIKNDLKSFKFVESSKSFLRELRELHEPIKLLLDKQSVSIIGFSDTDNLIAAKNSILITSETERRGNIIPFLKEFNVNQIDLAMLSGIKQCLLSQ